MRKDAGELTSLAGMVLMTVIPCQRRAYCAGDVLIVPKPVRRSATGGFRMDGEGAKVVVAVIGLIGGVIGLITAIVSRRKEVLNRHEFLHRHVAEPGKVAEQGKSVTPLPGAFVCPECSGSDLKRVKGLYGAWNRFVLTFLLVWPWVLSVVITASDFKRGVTKDYRWDLVVLGVCGTGIFMLPGVIFWLVMRRPLLRCTDCGARVLAKQARQAAPGTSSGGDG